jgi:hypothetical protein
VASVVIACKGRIAKFMSYNEKLPLAGNCENMTIWIFEFSELN